MKLTFTDFSLEPHACDYAIYAYPEYFDEDYCDTSNSECRDYVEVSFGSYNEKFCGSEVPGPITSTDNTMTVKFHSDGQRNDRGPSSIKFSAIWEAVPTFSSLPGLDLEWLHNYTVLRSEDTARISGSLRFARDLPIGSSITLGQLASEGVLVAVPGDLITLNATAFKSSFNGK